MGRVVWLESSGEMLGANLRKMIRIICPRICIYVSGLVLAIFQDEFEASIIFYDLKLVTLARSFAVPDVTVLERFRATTCIVICVLRAFVVIITKYNSKILSIIT